MTHSRGYRIFKIEETTDGKLHFYTVGSEAYKIAVTNTYVETADGSWLYSGTTIKGRESLGAEELVWLQEALGKAIKQIGEE